MEIFPHNEKHDFDLELVLEALKRCPCENGDIDLREYLVAYNELCRYSGLSVQFILEFMSRIRKCSDLDRTSKIATEVYEQTLSKHHPWFTRKMAAIAVYLLPSRKDLIHVMCKQEYQTALQLLDKVVTAGRHVYDLTEKLYSDHDLLYIP
ncbi:ceramide-1-phosphate transfer protein-like [Ruditapes philippinarum]|uniref:ceramide-1-phosphate transfer protein-like n=1 Tax=Ruditapes philippinarum TaxID=129788 RepID=UPI00295B804F|nr:ceramide-1-phosphate transfer protein-like [Ruditapes philippinarum]